MHEHLIGTLGWEGLVYRKDTYSFTFTVRLNDCCLSNLYQMMNIYKGIIIECLSLKLLFEDSQCLVAGVLVYI
jgi:hypothetical protein